MIISIISTTVSCSEELLTPTELKTWLLGTFKEDEGFLHLFLDAPHVNTDSKKGVETELWLLPLKNVILQVDSRKLVKIFK